MSETLITDPVELLAYLRETIGLPMRGLTWKEHVGWTTDHAKARRARETGARVVFVKTHTGWGEGYEIAVPRASSRAGGIPPWASCAP